MRFTDEILQEIIEILQDRLSSSDSVSFEVLNPDIAHCYSGNKVEVDGVSYIYRGYKSWMDLSEVLGCKFMTPLKIDKHIIKLHFVKLKSNSFHTQKVDDISEKYGIDSSFNLIHKQEESSFLYYYIEALKNAKIDKRANILDLGVNQGDEFETISYMLQDSFASKRFVGVDHSSSAIEYAKKRFESHSNVEFYSCDINHLSTLNLGRFDMLISIGTLQSTTLNLKPLLMSLVQEHLNSCSSIVLGFPNSRWIDTQLVYGAKVPNYTKSELGTLWSDVMFCKKYLQQKKYRVMITGKDYIFLSATKIGCCDE